MFRRIKSLVHKIKISHVILAWLILNLVSASFTILYNDEAYYWLYSSRLAWGYFDHPPMIALFIKAGTLLGKNEFFVRLFPVSGIAVALYCIYRLSGVQNPVLYLMSVLSVFALNLLGFLALPDAPLLLFTALFFVAYRRFLAKEDTLNTLLLALAMPAMLYSKYHGILVIFFTIVSNLKLIRSYRFLIAASLGLLLFIPHLVWQYCHGFVSFSYHVIERSASNYNFNVTVEYIIGQVLFYGPVTSVFIYWALIKHKAIDAFERALIWNAWGIAGFFLLSSLRGRVEPNWTLPALIPMLIIFMRYYEGRNDLLRRIYGFAPPVIILILLFRFQIVLPLINVPISRIDDIRNQKDFVKEVVAGSEGLPIVTGSYQKAGIISFYGGNFSPSINLNGRRNQFSIWHSSDSLRFHKVAYINNYMSEGVQIQNPSFRDFKITVIDSLPVMDDISISVLPLMADARMNQEFSISVLLSAGKPYDRYRDVERFKTRLYAQLYFKEKLVKEEICPIPVDILLDKYNGEYKFRFISPAEKGTYRIFFALKTSDLGTWSTGKVSGIKVD